MRPAKSLIPNRLLARRTRHARVVGRGLPYQKDSSDQQLIQLNIIDELDTLALMLTGANRWYISVVFAPKLPLIASHDTLFWSTVTTAVKGFHFSVPLTL